MDQECPTTAEPPASVDRRKATNEAGCSPKVRRSDVEKARGVGPVTTLRRGWAAGILSGRQSYPISMMMAAWSLWKTPGASVAFSNGAMGGRSLAPGRPRRRYRPPAVPLSARRSEEPRRPGEPVTRHRWHRHAEPRGEGGSDPWRILAANCAARRSRTVCNTYG